MDCDAGNHNACMRAVYDALAPEMQERISKLFCEHSLIHSRARLGFIEWTEAELEMMRPVRQALVRTHPSL